MRQEIFYDGSGFFMHGHFRVKKENASKIASSWCLIKYGLGLQTQAVSAQCVCA